MSLYCKWLYISSSFKRLLSPNFISLAHCENGQNVFKLKPTLCFPFSMVIILLYPFIFLDAQCVKSSSTYMTLNFFILHMNINNIKIEKLIYSSIKSKLLSIMKIILSSLGKIFLTLRLLLMLILGYIIL